MESNNINLIRKKKFIIYFLLIYVGFRLISYLVPLLSKYVSYQTWSVLLALFVFTIGLSFLILGIVGLKEGKIPFLSPILSTDYKVEKEYIVTKEKVHTGSFAFIVSIIALIIGLFLIGVVVFGTLSLFIN